MRTVIGAGIVAAGLLSGAAAALLLPEVPRLPFFAVLIGGGALAWRAWSAADARILTIAVLSAFFAGGALLSADAWERAWRRVRRHPFVTALACTTVAALVGAVAVLIISNERISAKEKEWADKVRRFLKAELKRAGVTYAELARRLNEHGFKGETEASVNSKLV